MANYVGFIGCMMVVFALVRGANAITYTVGDSYGWAVPPNGSIDFYANWASNKTFNIGDEVVFNWNGTHTATQVPKPYYDNCTKSGLVLASSGLGVTFNANDTLYFLCSVDTHCELGQKVTLVVGDGISDTNNDTGAASSLTVGVLCAFLSAMVVFLLNYI
ncbi:Cu_bind_like domain-containing protein [Cephalotus follicularis]|uniref:Cu_bind_like domain-containing protein n=1 Tax=Cephalotus follicularis TaxID=3775 RepID=A0A1Q3CQY1_CEPFO|nr:Cu_bind_like domain-containing protein [Cephalotus follicularis]